MVASVRQKTVSREASIAGPGLFSGEMATLTIAPAAPNSGITFVREQDGKVATIPAIVQNVLNRPRRTCLRNGTLFVETIEHCMAALAGLGVDNALSRCLADWSANCRREMAAAVILSRRSKRPDPSSRTQPSSR